MEKHVPKQKIKIGHTKHKCKLDTETRELIRRKQKAWQRYAESHYTDENKLTMFQRIRNKVRKARYHQKRQEREIANEAKSNPKKFWQYVNIRTKTTLGIADVETPQISNLANFFTSVFTKENLDNMPTIPNIGVDEGLKEYRIDPLEEVRKKLSKLNPEKSSGLDNLHSKTLKELSKALDKPLQILYQNTLTKRNIPDERKHANITGVFKKGDRNKPNKYRPVILTCILCKVMESLIRDKIMNHMKRNKLFSNKQFGFLDGRSTVLQLLVVLDKWTKIIDDGGTIDCIYCDFKKAFDKVPHRRLLKKVESYGIKGEILGWIAAFLSNRT